MILIPHPSLSQPEEHLFLLGIFRNQMCPRYFPNFRYFNIGLLSLLLQFFITKPLILLRKLFLSYFSLSVPLALSLCTMKDENRAF